MVLEEPAVLGVHGRVHQLDVQHRRVAVLGGAEVDALRQHHLALQQAPVGPHVHLLGDMAVGVDHVEVRRAAQPLPVLGRPGSRAHHHLLAGDGALVGLDRGHRARGVEGVAGHGGAVHPLHAPLAALLVQSPHRHVGARIPGAVLVQHHVAVLGLEVGPQVGEEGVRLGAGVHVGRVAAGRLRRLELEVVVGLVRLAHRHVADLLEAEVHGIGLPHLHAGPQDGVQRAGHVQVADAAAGQPGGARARPLLVDQHDVGARPLAGALEVHG